MKPQDIKVGRTYRNKGAGRTKRKVLEISPDLKVRWLGEGDPPKEPVVRFEQEGNESMLFLGSFASWAGKEEGTCPAETPNGCSLEPMVTINGKPLSEGQVMTLRVALGHFLADESSNGLGGIAKLYLD